MQNTKIIFKINAQERLELDLPCKLDDIFQLLCVNVVYIKDGDCEYPIYLDDEVSEFLYVIESAMMMVLTGKLTLDESIREDLGYLWNVYLHKQANAPAGHNIPEWEWTRCLILSVSREEIWLYIKNDIIFFEITPAYVWHFRDPEPDEKGVYIPFELFIKNYKPYVVTQLSRDVAREWLKQAQYLIAMMTFNDDRFLIREENEK